MAVSGGPDSTALLAGLVRLTPRFAYRLTVAHVGHGLRGAESTRDATAAHDLAVGLGLSCRTLPAPIAPGPNLEARARQARYRALRSAAQEVGASRILTGHTRDDQVETMLLRLLRGSGRAGLAGIAAQRGRLLRPLLAATRTDVRRFLVEQGLTATLDRSNADLSHRRNRVRRLLVPLLESEFNPRLGQTLAATAERLRDEDVVLGEIAARCLAELGKDGALSTAVGAEPRAIVRRVVRAWLQHRPPGRSRRTTSNGSWHSRHRGDRAGSTWPAVTPF